MEPDGSSLAGVDLFTTKWHHTGRTTLPLDCFLCPRERQREITKEIYLIHLCSSF